MELLLEADPSKDMINDYLRDGELFVLTYKDDEDDDEEIIDGDLHCIDMYYYSKDLKK